MKILILCTGNSCRSQMAHGFLKSFDPMLSVYSGGTKPESKVNPYAVKVMKEAGVDISDHLPVDAAKYTDTSFDWVITLCDKAKETCPVFKGKVACKMHISFDDPSAYNGSEEQILKEYRRIRDQILERFKAFYNKRILQVDQEG